MNRAILIGRLTREPELAYTQNGKAYLRFSLAISNPYNKEETDFINCVAWEKKAELLSQYVSKGNRLCVEGSLKNSNYEKNGVNYRSDYVLVEKIEFLESNRESSPITNKETVAVSEDDDFPF